jgi:hypothetical protein
MGRQIRYIVLTDVHLGAGNSILTQVAPGQTMADTHHPSPALLSLPDCLRTLVAGGGRLDGDPSHRIGPMLLDREPAIVSVPLTALLQAATGRGERALCNVSHRERVSLQGDMRPDERRSAC